MALQKTTKAQLGNPPRFQCRCVGAHGRRLHTCRTRTNEPAQPPSSLRLNHHSPHPPIQVQACLDGNRAVLPIDADALQSLRVLKHAATSGEPIDSTAIRHPLSRCLFEVIHCIVELRFVIYILSKHLGLLSRLSIVEPVAIRHLLSNTEKSWVIRSNTISTSNTMAPKSRLQN